MMSRSSKPKLGVRSGFAASFMGVGASFVMLSAAVAQGIEGIGTISSDVDVSADGAAVEGESGEHAFRWTGSTGMSDLGTLKADNSGVGSASAVSADGMVVVGAADYADWQWPSRPRLHAFRWTESDGMIDLGTLKADNSGGSSAYDVSADGAVVVGKAHNDLGDFRAYRWTNNGGMSDLGTLKADNSGSSSAYGVSADGAVVVGSADNDLGDFRAYRWTNNGGMSDLGTLKADNSGSSSAYGVSADGTIVVGSADNGVHFHYTTECFAECEHHVISEKRAFHWTKNGGMTDLGTLKADNSGSSQANAVSADGAVVVGSDVTLYHNDNDENPFFDNYFRAFRWTESTGMTDLGTLKADNSGMSDAKGVSADGTVVVGWANNDDNRIRDYDDLRRREYGYAFRAFRWTESGGMTDLGTLKSDNSGDSYANAVSADGTVVVGSADSDSGNRRAFIWRSETMLDHVNAVEQILGASSDIAANLMTLQGDLIALSDRELFVSGDRRRFAAAKSVQDVGRNISRPPMALRLDIDNARNDNVGDTAYAGGTLAVGFGSGFTVGGSLQYGSADSDYGDLSYDGDFWGVSAYVRKRSTDATGLTWKLGAGYSRVDSDITRKATLANTEKGRGNTNIKNAVALAEIGYGQRYGRALITPHLSLVHSSGTSDGYTEMKDIAFPVTYDDYDYDLTVAALAAEVIIGLSAATVLELEVGVEADLHRSNDPVTGASQVTDDFRVDAPDVSNKNRAFFSVALRHNFATGRALEGRFGLRQSPFTNALTYSAGISYVMYF